MRKPLKAIFSSPNKCKKAAHAGVRIQTEPRNGFLRGAILFERVVASSGEEYLDESTLLGLVGENCDGRIY